MFHAALLTRMSIRPKWPNTFSTEIDRLAVSLIELNGVAPPAGPSDRLHRRISTTGFAYIGYDDIRAGASESLRNRFPNIAGTSGDERDFSIEIHGVPSRLGKRLTANGEIISLST